MPGGRPRKPRKTKIIQHTFRKDRNPGEEPEPRPVSDVPKPPAGMNRWARRLWKQLAPELHELGILTTVDLTTLQLCCDAYGLYEEAKQAVYHPVNPFSGKRMSRSLEEYLAGIDPWAYTEDLTASDLATLMRNSQTSPELAAMKSGWQTYKGFMVEFGLSPASRNRINVPAPKAKKSRMEELVGNRV